MKLCETIKQTSTLVSLSRFNNLDLRYGRYDFFPDFYFDDLEVDECLYEFRFHKRGLPSFTEMK